MKRYWLFESAEYEERNALQDLTQTNSSKKKLFELAKKSREWAAVFDSKTGETWNFEYGWTDGESFINKVWVKEIQK